MSPVLQHCIEASLMYQYALLEKKKRGAKFKDSIAFKIAQAHGLLEKLEVEMKKVGGK